VESLRHDSATGDKTQRRGASPRARRVFDVVLAAAILLVAAPLIVLLAVAIKLESPGPVLYRCRRVGRGGRELNMLKFRKMKDGAGGPALAAPNDERFTRLGPGLARTKLDELPQLWNVLKGEMSLVGPRPEDPVFVELNQKAYAPILAVRPGITGLSQLAFARESQILDETDRVGDYTNRILPQKIRIDQLYTSGGSLRMDLKVLRWTVMAVVTGREVAVNRETGELTTRLPRESVLLPVPAEGTEAA